MTLMTSHINGLEKIRIMANLGKIIIIFELVIALVNKTCILWDRRVEA